MKAILISVRPEWVAKILNGQKTIEIRKTAPKCDLPIDVYIYCTKGGDILYAPNGYNEHYWTQKHGPIKWDLRGKVVAKFRLEKTVPLHMQMGAPYGYGNNGYMGYGYCGKGDFRWWYKVKDEACLEEDELCKYLNGGKTLRQIAVGRLKAESGYAWHISDLVIFDEPKPLSDFGLTKAPQSWQYVEVE